MDNQVKEPELLQRIDTKLCADSTEWCPAVGKENILLCGTYQLQEHKKEERGACNVVRIGTLQSYSLSGLEVGHARLSLEEEKHMHGILDIKWCHDKNSDYPSFALVDAVGDLQLWGFSDKNGMLKVCSANLGEPCLGLSLDWSCQEPTSIIASDSTGSLTMFKVGSNLSVASKWKAHDYEAWICAFDHWNDSVIYSGSDDSTLKCWDVRGGQKSLVFTNKRAKMGVCSIQSNPCKEHLLAVGSYDENLYIYDTRTMHAPISTLILGGGIWRVKWDPFNGEKVLTATMYNGFHIVDCSKPGKDPLLIYTHYSSDVKLGYGADWCSLNSENVKHHGLTTNAEVLKDFKNPNHNIKCDDKKSGNDVEKADIPTITDSKIRQSPFIIATCSFYDHSLQLWKA